MLARKRSARSERRACTNKYIALAVMSMAGGARRASAEPLKPSSRTAGAKLSHSVRAATHMADRKGHSIELGPLPVRSRVNRKDRDCHSGNDRSAQEKIACAPLVWAVGKAHQVKGSVTKVCPVSGERRRCAAMAHPQQRPTTPRRRRLVMTLISWP